MRSAVSSSALRIPVEELLFSAGIIGFSTIWFVLRSAISWQIVVVPHQVPLLLVFVVQALPTLSLATVLVTIRWRRGRLERLHTWFAAGVIAFLAAHAAGLGFRRLAGSVEPASPELWAMLVVHTVLLAGSVVGIFWLVARYEQQVTGAFRTLGLLVLASAVLVTPALVIDADDRPSYLFAPVSEQPGTRGDAAQSASPPVYVLVLDELAYPALLDSDGAIDATRFPNIARVANQGVVFTNVTANYFNTSYALPALVDTLTPFTAVGELRVHTQYHEVEVALDQVCGGRVVCAGADEVAVAGSERMLRHALVGFAEDLVPAPYSSFSRGILNSLAGAADVPASAADRTALHLYSDDLMSLALDGIERETAANSITLIHSLASHHPFVLEADGTPYSHPYTIKADGYYGANELRFTGDATDVWIVPPQLEGMIDPPALEGLMEAYQSQIAYSDSMLGDLLTRLESEGLLDESILIVTSDHGLRQDLRSETRDIQVDQWVTRIPLIVRAPNLAPAVRAEPVQFRDIAATIFRLLDLDLEAAPDTRSAFEASAGIDRQRWMLVSGRWLHYETEQRPWPIVAELPATPDRDRGPNLPQLDGALVTCFVTLGSCAGDLAVDEDAAARLDHVDDLGLAAASSPQPRSVVR
jgi:hypothetical protein